MGQTGRQGDKQATDDNTIGSMRLVHWITKTKDTHSAFVILMAFPRQRCL
jgi:hypothetical protein